MHLPHVRPGVLVHPECRPGSAPAPKTRIATHQRRKKETASSAPGDEEVTVLLPHQVVRRSRGPQQQRAPRWHMVGVNDDEPLSKVVLALQPDRVPSPAPLDRPCGVVGSGERTQTTIAAALRGASRNASRRSSLDAMAVRCPSSTTAPPPLTIRQQRLKCSLS